MALSESERVACGGTNSDSHGQPQRSPSHPHDFLTDSSSFGKQNSIFALTLDEIQLKSGKSVGSMNMDEFLANLWNNVEENQVSSYPNNQNQNETINEKDSADQPTVAYQGSFSIPTPLCNKTVDEVWFEIHKDLPQGRKANNISKNREPQRQHTFGEMTLEDFLVRAGIVQEQPHSSQQKKGIPPQNNNPSLDANFSTGHVMGSSHQQNTSLLPPLRDSNIVSLDASFGMGNALGMGFSSHQNTGNNFSANGYATTYPMFPQSRSFFGDTSTIAENGNTSQCMLESGAVPTKRRIIDGPPEVVVERRQRRMIKNRESAARSRARKQAYTVELELELNQLREENEKLKQLLEENEQRRKQEVLKGKQLAARVQKKHLKTVRRTVSLEW